GEEEPALRALVRALGLERAVQFRGALPVEQVAAAMRTASLVVLPCVVAADGNVDALPTVLLEAMACGLPVVSTALSGIPEIVADGETGYLVPPGDPAALAAAMRRLLEDCALAERLGRAGRERARDLLDLRTQIRRVAPGAAGEVIGSETLGFLLNQDIYLGLQRFHSRWRIDVIYERYSLWGHAALRFARDHGIPFLLEVNAPLRLEQARYR